MKARGFRESRFSASNAMSEDVNPSAYIVNLADCMLVLAVGFMVALVAHWNIDVSVPELDQSNLEQVDPQVSDRIAQDGGSYYEEAGTVYRDPNTGVLYMVQDGAAGSAADGSGSSGAQGGGGQVGSGSGSGGSSASGSPGSAGQQDEQAIRNARANGAD